MIFRTKTLIIALLIGGAFAHPAGEQVCGDLAGYPNQTVFSLAQLEGCLADGVNLALRDDEGQSALHRAATYVGDPAVITALVEAGFDVNGRDAHGYTPLHLATGPYAFHPDVVSALITLGADVNAQSTYGRTPLHGLGLYENAAEMAGLLIAAGARVDLPDAYGGTVLHRPPLGDGAAAFVATLLAAGADPQARDKDGRTPLHRVVQSSPPAVIELLLQAGADVNAQDKYARTPLIVAAKHTRNVQVVEVLLAAGADPGIMDRHGLYAADYAVKNRALKAHPIMEALLARSP